MPIYEYQARNENRCDYCHNGFELMKKLSEPELERCPRCGGAVIQVISAPNLTKAGPSLDSATIEKHGFTQYKKSGKGVYEKTAGKGPRVISSEPD